VPVSRGHDWSTTFACTGRAAYLQLVRLARADPCSLVAATASNLSRCRAGSRPSPASSTASPG